VLVIVKVFENAQIPIGFASGEGELRRKLAHIKLGVLPTQADKTMAVYPIMGRLQTVVVYGQWRKNGRLAGPFNVRDDCKG
jgi:hypothetical protein